MFNLNNYLRQLVGKFDEFKTPGEHFARASGIGEIEELLMNIKNIKGIVVVAIDTQDGTAGDNGNDVYLDVTNHRFYLLKKTKLNDFQARENTLTELKNLAKKIIYKMREDKRNARHGLLFADLTRIPYITVGPLADGYIGLELFFNTVQKLLSETNITDDENF